MLVSNTVVRFIGVTAMRFSEDTAEFLQGALVYAWLTGLCGAGMWLGPSGVLWYVVGSWVLIEKLG